MPLTSPAQYLSQTAAFHAKQRLAQRWSDYVAWREGSDHRQGGSSAGLKT